MAVYRPRLVTQVDGTRFQWYNCNMACAAIALDRHTLGRKTSTGWKMRNCQFDQSGGTDLIDAKVAWDRCYNEYFDVRLKISWSTFIAAIKAGRGATIAGQYGYIPYSYRRPGSTNIGHAMYINEIRESDGALLVYDPLKSTPYWIPQVYIKRFAGYFRLASGNILGYGYVQAAFTKITGSVTTPPPTTTPVTLKYGGVAITPNLMEAKVSAKQRRSPYIRTDNIIQVVSPGKDFKAFQKTTKGTNVNGSTVWYGNSYGTNWMHSSVLKDI